MPRDKSNSACCLSVSGGFAYFTSSLRATKTRRSERALRQRPGGFATNTISGDTGGGKRQNGPPRTIFAARRCRIPPRPYGVMAWDNGPAAWYGTPPSTGLPKCRLGRSFRLDARVPPRPRIFLSRHSPSPPGLIHFQRNPDSTPAGVVAESHPAKKFSHSPYHNPGREYNQTPPLFPRIWLRLAPHHDLS